MLFIQTFILSIELGFVKMFKRKRNCATLVWNVLWSLSQLRIKWNGMQTSRSILSVILHLMTSGVSFNGKRANPSFGLCVWRCDIRVYHRHRHCCLDCRASTQICDLMLNCPLSKKGKVATSYIYIWICVALTKVHIAITQSEYNTLTATHL